MLLGFALHEPARAGSILQTKFFGEVYNETISLGREERNVITMTQALQGARARIAAITTVDLYFKQRFGGDANRDYWNNRGELMLGARARFFQKVYLGLFAEYIQGRYFDIESSDNPNPYGSNYDDVRYGLIFWQGWDREMSSPSPRRFPLSFWNEIYADFIHYHRDRANNILYLKAKAGLRMLRAHKTVLDLYGIQYLNYDTNGDFWNNKAELGPGVQVKPWTDFAFSLFVEYLRGSYYNRSGRYENPYPMKYNEVRAGLIFWWGREF
jgi:hypothetical protein